MTSGQFETSLEQEGNLPCLEATSAESRNLLFRLPEPVLKILISFLGSDLVKLDTAMLHRQGRAALHDACRGTKVHGWKFLYDLPFLQEESPDELCEGLQWTEGKGLIACNYILDIPTEEAPNHFQHLVKMRRRRMALLLIHRCAHSYEWNGTPGRYTPLMIAAASHELNLMMTLLSTSTINVNAKSQTKNDYSALHWIVRGESNEYLREVKLLLSHEKIDVNLRGDKGRAPLHLAVRNGNIEESELLLSHGADVNQLDDEGETPMDAAYYSYQPTFDSVVELLRAEGGKFGRDL